MGSGRVGPGREYSDFSLKYERTRSARCARSLVTTVCHYSVISLRSIILYRRGRLVLMGRLAPPPGPFKDEVSSSNLTVTNTSEKRITFKIKTTAPKRYCVRPNQGIVEPGSTVSIAGKPTSCLGSVSDMREFISQCCFIVFPFSCYAFSRLLYIHRTLGLFVIIFSTLLTM